MNIVVPTNLWITFYFMGLCIAEIKNKEKKGKGGVVRRECLKTKFSFSC